MHATLKRWAIILLAIASMGATPTATPSPTPTPNLFAAPAPTPGPTPTPIDLCALDLAVPPVLYCDATPFTIPVGHTVRIEIRMGPVGSMPTAAVFSISGSPKTFNITASGGFGIITTGVPASGFYALSAGIAGYSTNALNMTVQ